MPAVSVNYDDTRSIKQSPLLSVLAFKPWPGCVWKSPYIYICQWWTKLVSQCSKMLLCILKRKFTVQHAWIMKRPYPARERITWRHLIIVAHRNKNMVWKWKLFSNNPMVHRNQVADILQCIYKSPTWFASSLLVK